MRRNLGMCHHAAVVLAFAASTAYAQGAIRKCIGADGKVVYQDVPCESGKKTAGRVQRDRSSADPAGLKRAQAERERAARFAASRMKQQAAEDEKARAADAEAQAYARAAAADAEANAAAEPRYYYVPLPLAEQPVQLPRSAGASPAILQRPGILDTPAPCKTAQCEKRR